MFNKGGYILRVDWYDPGKVLYTDGDANDYNNYKTQGDPRESEKITLGLSSCTDVANRTAIVSIQDGHMVNNGISIGVGAVVGVASSVAGAIVCVGTVGAGCPAATIAAATVVTTATSAAFTALPEVKDIAYIGVPGTVNYLDFSGTAWKPGIKSSVPLSTDRSNVMTSVSNWITDGKPGPKSITFNNQAGYVASMFVMYFDNVQGQPVSIPVAKTSPKITAGFSRHINLPVSADETKPVTVMITGVGTLNNRVFNTTLPGDFAGNRCFKSWGTIFSPQGGQC